MNDGVIAVWAEIMLAVPNSRLMLKAKQFIDDVAKQDVISRFAIHGIEQDRLHLRNLTARVNYLKPYNEIDIALDPFPYPGITTTVESLFMGVPVLTLAGTSFLSRQGVGLLSNAGLPQWVAADAETYVSKAIEFSKDLSALDGIRRQLRSQVMASPIFNVPEFATHFEQAMIGMWQAKMKAKVALSPSEKIHKSPPQEQAVGTQSNPISELVALYRAGSYTEVVRRADVLLKGDPGAGLVWKLLGSALLVQKQPALPALQRACELLPADADAHNNLAAAFHALGHYGDAVASYRSALALKPERAETHHNIGISLAKLSKSQAAVTSFRHSIKLNPNAPAVFVSLAFAHRSLGEFTDAAHALKEALRLTPNDSKIRALLADTEFQQGEVQLAIASYRQAIMLRPQDAPTHRALGLALAQSVGSDAALQSLERAVSLAPDDAANHYAIACTLRDLGRLHDAETHLLESIRIQPANADFYVNLGTVRGGLGLASEAELAYREALKIDPQSANAHNNLGNLLVSSGRLDEAFRSFEGAIAFAPGMLGARSNQLFSRQYLSNADSLESQTATKTDACALGGLLANNAKEFLSWPNSNWPVGAGDTLLSRPLRVGMVSGDLRQHPVGDFLVGLLTSLAHSTAGRLELVAYANHLMNDAITRQIRTNCHEWHVVSGLSDLNLAQKINSHGIDVLIDLSGHSGHNRLGALAYKPAPVQASWLGYLGTTGLAAIDYLIADELTLPVADEIFFSEKIWRLPRTYLCFTRPETEASVTPLPALTNGFVTFACFNNLAKMNDLVVACWARIMQLVPQSRLCLKAKQFSEASLRRLTIERFAAHGIDETRLVLKGQAPRHSYLNDYQLVDIALDPFPYPGVTTTVEGLYMGVPALTLGGKSFLARQGIGLLTNAGLPDWIASDHDDYVTRAVALANDIGRLSQVRERLREQVAASPLFDAAEFSRNFEQALRSMWLAKRSF
jgi:protein O-GlcNAc transferase